MPSSFYPGPDAALEVISVECAATISRRDGSVKIWIKLLSLTKRWCRIAKRRRGKLFRPHQFLLPLQPLLEKDFDLSSSIRPEAYGTNHGRHVRRGDGVADIVPIETTRPGYRVGEDLNARVGRTDNRVSRAIEALLMRVIHLGHFGVARGKVPPRREQKIIAVLAKVLRPDRRIGRPNKDNRFRIEIQFLHLLDDRHAVGRRRQGEHRFGSSRFSFQNQVGKILGAGRIFAACHYLITILLGEALPERAHLLAPVRPFEEKCNFGRSLGCWDRSIEEDERLFR